MKNLEKIHCTKLRGGGIGTTPRLNGIATSPVNPGVQLQILLALGIGTSP